MLKIGFQSCLMDAICNVPHIEINIISEAGHSNINDVNKIMACFTIEKCKRSELA